MRRSHALVAVTLGVLASHADALSIDCSAAPFNTLTKSCPESKCAGLSCIYFDRSENQITSCDFSSASVRTACYYDDGCDVKCFKSYPKESAFMFNIVRPQENRHPVLRVDNLGSVLVDRSLDTYSFEEDAYLTHIGPLPLASSIEEVVIFGGGNLPYQLDAPLQVAVDRGFLDDGPQVTTLRLHDLQLGEQLASGIARLALPRGLTTLDLTNVELSNAPTDLASSLPALTELTLSNNLLRIIPSSMKADKLSKLVLRGNRLTRFEAQLPSLAELDLDSNLFTSIPPVIFTLDNLRTLKLTGNPIRSIEMTETQFKFLSSRLEQFEVDDMDRPDAVADSTVDKLHGVWVRILSASSSSSGSLDRSPKSKVGSNSKSSDTSDASSTSGSSSGRDDASSGTSGSTSSDDTKGPVKAGGDSKPFGNDTTTNPDDLPDSGSTGTSSSTYLSVSVGAAVFVALLALVVIVVLRRRKAHQEEENQSTDLSTVQSPSSSQESGAAYAKLRNRRSSSRSVVPSSGLNLSSIRVAANDIKDVRVIGAGEGTVTWLVQYRRTTLLVSKRLLESTTSDVHEQRRAKFIGEIAIAAELSHPNIVTLVGVAWTNERDLQVLFEYMGNGDLRSHLARAPQTTWQPQSLSTAIDIIEALVYAHSFNPPLVHRDLQSQNILLDDNMKAKVSGFGDARYASEDGTMTSTGVGSSRWLAPEVLLGSSTYDASVDVYAFGVLLSELDTHALPYEDVSGSIGETELVQRVARGNLRPRFSDDCPGSIVALAAECMATNPTQRPTSVQVAYRLRCA